jgi:hypothetical protein
LSLVLPGEKQMTTFTAPLPIELENALIVLREISR